MKNRHNNKIIFKILSPILIILVLSLPVVAMKNIIPDTIKFIAGKTHNIKYYYPLNANLYIEDNDALVVNNQSINQNTNINISKPFSIKFEETGQYNAEIKLFGLIPVKSIKIDVIDDMKLIPCGKTIGVQIQTDGVLVLGTGAVKGVDGNIYEPSKGQLYTGDIIEEANNKKLHNKNDLINTIRGNKDKNISFKINRNDKVMSVTVKPVASQQDSAYKIGAWVRDSTQGIGTITYINPETNCFGALGHPVTDVDTDEIFPVGNGDITNAKIISIKKGTEGEAGEMEGAILADSKNIIGDIHLNTKEGIFGDITNSNFDLLYNKPMPIALNHEVQEGKAYILSNVEGNKIEKYDVNIYKVSELTGNMSKGMVVEITDKKLLEKTNGIIQGMSGSPIIQNGKLIGAITHVFIQNPAKGYGIYIENMIKKEKLLNK